MDWKLPSLTFLTLFLCAFCCSCTKRTPRENFCSSSFSAIVAITNRATSCLEWHVCYEVEVHRRFKPTSGTISEIITSNHTAACGHEFQVGMEYLVHGQMLGLSTQAASKAEVYSCSMPVLWSTMSYLQKKSIIAEVSPTEPCKKKRKRVL